MALRSATRTRRSSSRATPKPCSDSSAQHSHARVNLHMATTLTEPPATRRSLEALLENYSFEVTAKDIRSLEDAAPAVPPGTKIAITFLPNEDFPARVAMAVRLRQLGFVPVPHISARRLKSQAELESFLEALQREAAIDRAFVVAGDPPQPQ